MARWAWWLVGLVACGAAPPPSAWAGGGAATEAPSARWSFGGSAVRIEPSGGVYVGDAPTFLFDRSGRVRDRMGHAVAILQRDGRLVGPGDETLATVRDDGVARGEGTAISISSTGAVLRHESDGDRPSGAWEGGCTRSPEARRTCAIVTYLLVSAADRSDERLEAAERRKTRNHPSSQR